MTYTRKQFEEMTALDVVCPLKRCGATAGEPCTQGRDRVPYTNGFHHAYRIRDVNRLKHAAYTFFDAMEADVRRKFNRAGETGIPF